MFSIITSLFIFINNNNCEIYSINKNIKNIDNIKCISDLNSYIKNKVNYTLCDKKISIKKDRHILDTNIYIYSDEDDYTVEFTDFYMYKDEDPLDIGLILPHTNFTLILGEIKKRNYKHLTLSSKYKKYRLSSFLSKNDIVCPYYKIYL